MSERPQRKIIRLKGYDYSRNNAYFITACTHKRQILFSELTLNPKDMIHAQPDELRIVPRKAYFLVEKWINKIEDKFPEYIFDAYTIMPDHIHIIFVKCSPDNTGASLSSVIQWLKTQTTNEYIKGVRDGEYPAFFEKLWQRSYYDHIIRNDADMQEARKYIYENPQKYIGMHNNL